MKLKKSKKIMAYSTKGGVGKSTSLLTIAQYFSKKGYRICIIDADPQANLSKTILKDEVFKDEYLSMTDLFSAKVDCEKVHKAIYNVTDNLDIIGSSLALVNSEQLVRSNIMCDQGRIINKITQCIEDEYDIILLDFNPFPSLLTTNGFIASDFVIIPTTCDEWAADGVATTLSQIYQVIEGFGKEIKYKVLINQKSRNKDDRAFEEEINAQLNADQLFKTNIHYQAKPFKNKDICVTDFNKGNTTVGQEWQSVLDEIEREVLR